MEEREINLKDLLKYILLRWRVLLYGMLVGMIALSGVYFLKASKRTVITEPSVSGEVETETETETETEIDILELKSALSARELEEVSVAVGMYETYRTNFLKATEYLKNSVRMNIDPNHVPTLNVSYNIDNHYQTIYPVIYEKDTTTDIINAYSSKLINDDILRSICDTLGEEIKPSYVEELISVARTGNSSLSITVIADDRNTCEKIMESLTEAVKQITPAVKELYGEFDITEYDRSYVEQIDTKLLDEQQAKVADLNNFKNYHNNIANYMSEAQKKYYYAVLDERAEKNIEKEEQEWMFETEIETEVETEIETEVETETEFLKEEIISVPVKKFSFIYAIMGLLLGFLAVAGYYMLKYIAGNNLHMAEEMEQCFGIQVFGILHISEMKKRKFGKIDSAIGAFFRTERESIPTDVQMEIIRTRIVSAVQKSGAKKVYLSGVCQNEAAQKYIATMQEQLQGDVEFVSYGASVLNNVQSLKNLIESECVVLMECVNGSAYDSIQREIVICKENGVKIIGSVVFN